MKFLPYDRVTYKTNLRPEEVQQRLENSIEPSKIRWFSFGKREAHKPYEGTLTWPTFSINRVIFYRNSFLPMIRGEAKDEMGQTTITVTMHPHILVLAFMVLWLIVPINLFIAGLAGAVNDPTADNTQLLLIALPFLIFGAFLFLGPYKWEASKSKKFFQELFEATETQES